MASLKASSTPGLWFHIPVDLNPGLRCPVLGSALFSSVKAMAADLRGHCIYSACVAEAPLGGIYPFEKQSLKVLTRVMSFTPLSQLKGKMFDILARIISLFPRICAVF